MFDWLKTEKTTQPRKGMPSPELDEAEFKRRFLAQFQDPCFEPLAAELVRVSGAAWDAYINSRKAPRTRKAGAGYADPDYELSLDWIAAAAAVKDAKRRHEDPTSPARFLLINGSSRSEHTCPGEMSKSFRLAQIARAEFAERKTAVDFSTCRGLHLNTDGTFIRAKPASRHRPRYVTGRAPAIRITRLARRRIG
jgi:hypothetical protein